jgi:ATP-dependent DNA helicase RecQ
MNDLQKQIERTARNIFGWSDLWDGQAAAITSVVEGLDTVAILPTGFGKSAIYQGGNG